MTLDEFDDLITVIPYIMMETPVRVWFVNRCDEYAAFLGEIDDTVCNWPYTDYSKVILAKYKGIEVRHWEGETEYPADGIWLELNSGEYYAVEEAAQLCVQSTGGECDPTKCI